MNFKENTIIIMDTNVLLDLYRYQPSTIEKIIESLRWIKESIYLPNQVEVEFYRRYTKCRSDNISKYNKIGKEINSEIEQLIKSIEKKYKLYNKIDFKDSKEEIKNLVDKLIEIKEINTQQIERINEGFLKNYRQIICEEDIIEKFVKSIENKNLKFRIRELIDIYEEGEKRYKYNISPGYTDKDKAGKEKYGDLILWKEILKIVKDKKINLIFIENERKQDWWSNFEKLEPQEILKEEFYESANIESNFEMIPFEIFVDRYEGELNISTEIKNEIKRNNILEKLKENFEQCVEKSIDIDWITEKIDEESINFPVSSGYITEVNHNDNDLIDIKLQDITMDYDEISLEVELLIINNLVGEVYINKEINEGIEVNSKIRMDVNLNYAIDLDDNESIDVNSFYGDVVSYDIKILELEERYLEYEIYDYKSYENTCPKCGRGFNLDRCAGNGFCIDCEED